MALLTKRKNSLSTNRSSDLFDTGRFFCPSIFDIRKALNAPFVIPEANIIENDKDYRVELATPGLEKKDFNIEMENGVLTITAEKKEEKEEKKSNFRRREFSYNSLYRSFTLPENSNPDKVEAKYENGLLRLSIPKKKESQPPSKKQIQIA